MSSNSDYDPEIISPPPPERTEPLFHMLPVEVIGRIMDYLQPRSVFNLSVISKRLHIFCAVASARRLLMGKANDEDHKSLSHIAGDRVSHGRSIWSTPQESALDAGTGPENRESTDPLRAQSNHRDAIFMAKVMAKRAKLESDIKQLHLDTESSASMQVHGGSTGS